MSTALKLIINATLLTPLAPLLRCFEALSSSIFLNLSNTSWMS